MPKIVMCGRRLAREGPYPHRTAPHNPRAPVRGSPARVAFPQRCCRPSDPPRVGAHAPPSASCKPETRPLSALLHKYLRLLAWLRCYAALHATFHLPSIGHAVPQGSKQAKVLVQRSKMVGLLFPYDATVCRWQCGRAWGWFILRWCPVMSLRVIHIAGR